MRLVLDFVTVTAHKQLLHQYCSKIKFILIKSLLLIYKVHLPGDDLAVLTVDKETVDVSLLQSVKVLYFAVQGAYLVHRALGSYFAVHGTLHLPDVSILACHVYTVKEGTSTRTGEG